MQWELQLFSRKPTWRTGRTTRSKFSFSKTKTNKSLQGDDWTSRTVIKGGYSLHDTACRCGFSFQRHRGQRTSHSNAVDAQCCLKAALDAANSPQQSCGGSTADYGPWVPRAPAGATCSSRRSARPGAARKGHMNCVARRVGNDLPAGTRAGHPVRGTCGIDNSTSLLGSCCGPARKRAHERAGAARG